VKVTVVKNILDANDRIAAENRSLFDSKGIYVINVMSSPGAGKTSLVERTIQALGSRYRIGVIEGDIQDTFDADRVAALGTPVVQINTGGACHIDANMVREALPGLDLDRMDLLINENVGNLVCPAEFAIGENCKDKPAKYPSMFKESAALVINKIDLMPYVDFDMARARRAALTINQDLRIFEVSCRTSEGLDAWFRWLGDRIDAFKARRVGRAA
jgi:hydrogenase nickel incorporation protein HypB